MADKEDLTPWWLIMADKEDLTPWLNMGFKTLEEAKAAKESVAKNYASHVRTASPQTKE